ncbi:hypothetical protein J7L65_07595 [Candidatus Bathyarchaeota archaeon]|nr:hypothetical protein [Candidatus Bathyarchaeota archaeon]
MCQLAAYVGGGPIAPLLLRAIELQESYFGGHASGLGVVDDGVIKIEKDIGPVERVRKTTKIESLEGSAGIAHSRFGYGFYDPRYNTKRMAHPFPDCTGELALMHNGNINNYKELWGELRGRHTFTSYEEEVDNITDSEVAVHLLEDALAEGLSMEEALRRVASRLKGSFLLACIWTEEPDAVWIANWHQPCVIAVGYDESMFCSNPIGFEHVRDRFHHFFEPPKNSIIKLERGRVTIMPLDPERRAPELHLDRELLKELILEVLRREGETDVRDLWYKLFPEGWAKALGISKEEAERLIMKEGVTIGNPYFEVLDELVEEGLIRRRVDRRLEAGVEGVPRFTYSLREVEKA